MLRWALALLLLSATTLFAPDVRACSTCSVGDPTITVLGVGQPYQNRFRVSLASRQRRERYGSPGLQSELLEHRLELGLAWAPTSRLVVSAMIPLVHQRVRFPNLARERRFGPGDAELRVRAVLYRDRDLGARHLVSGILGLELPTAPEVRDDGGQAGFERQLGSGSVDPILGVLYSHFAAPHSIHLMGSVVVGTPGRFGVRAGTSGRLLARYQWQPWKLGLELGIDGRVDGRDHFEGAPDSESGGGIVWLSGGLVGRIGTDLVLRFVASVPVVQSLRGGHQEGVALVGSVVLDV